MNSLPAGSINRPERSRKKLEAVLLGVALTVAALPSCLGDEVPLFPALLLFPYGFLFGGLCAGLLHSGALALSCLGLGLLQFPTYGYWLGRAWSRGKLIRTVLVIISAHLTTIGLFFAAGALGWLG